MIRKPTFLIYNERLDKLEPCCLNSLMGVLIRNNSVTGCRYKWQDSYLYSIYHLYGDWTE